MIKDLSKKDFGCLKIGFPPNGMTDDNIVDNLANIEEIGLGSFVKVERVNPIPERGIEDKIYLTIFYRAKNTLHLVPKITTALELKSDPAIYDNRHLTADEWATVKELLSI